MHHRRRGGDPSSVVGSAGLDTGAWRPLPHEAVASTDTTSRIRMVWRVGIGILSRGVDVYSIREIIIALWTDCKPKSRLGQVRRGRRSTTKLGSISSCHAISRPCNEMGTDRGWIRCRAVRPPRERTHTPMAFGCPSVPLQIPEAKTGYSVCVVTGLARCCVGHCAADSPIAAHVFLKGTLKPSGTTFSSSPLRAAVTTDAG